MKRNTKVTFGNRLTDEESSDLRTQLNAPGTRLSSPRIYIAEDSPHSLFSWDSGATEDFFNPHLVKKHQNPQKIESQPNMRPSMILNKLRCLIKCALIGPTYR